tara:strand:- start:1544 stop:1873 length:330 start_codon:yes stop_codon:yes gene_type:complete
MNTSADSHANMALFIWVAISVLFIVTDDRRMKTLADLWNDKKFVYGLVPIALFSVLSLNFYPRDYDNYDKFTRATKQAIIALIIAVCAAVDLRLSPFYLIWITSYYFDM